MKTPAQYLNTIEEPHKSQLKDLHKVITKVAPKLKPWVLESAHGTILGYGKYEYHTKSGCQGDWFTIGLSSRKNYIALYLCAIKNVKYITEYYQKKLPKLKMGKSCINIKDLEKVDMKVLTEMIKEASKFHASMGGTPQ